MSQIDQSIFQNFTKKTQYLSSSKKITDQHQVFPKYRKQEIENQFQIVDLHHKGKLTQKQIITYLSDKYQWVNINVLKEVFKTMVWDEDESVAKDQFVGKYLDRERKLYNEINGLKYYENWVRTLDEIYSTSTRNTKPRVYFYTQVRHINLYNGAENIEWLDLVVEYENHSNQISYQIQQVMHQTSYPSFEVWLPAWGQNFFLKFKFYDSNDRSNYYGQAYLNISLEDKVSKVSMLEISITKNGKNVGQCEVCAYAEPSMEKVRDQLNQIRLKQRTYEDVTDDKVKEYEYLQFLWGVRHRSPHKVSELDVGWMLAFRMTLLIILGCLGTIVHILGRCQPLSIIIMFLILKNWNNVLLRHEKFLLSALTACSILLDVIWIALASKDPNQVNFMALQGGLICTYILLGFKIILMGYLIIAQKSLTSD